MAYSVDNLFEDFEKAEGRSTDLLLKMRDSLNEALVEVENTLSQVRSIGDNYREAEMRLKGGTLSPVIEEESLDVLVEASDAIENLSESILYVNARSNDVRVRTGDLSDQSREINQHIVNRMP